MVVEVTGGLMYVHTDFVLLNPMANSGSGSFWLVMSSSTRTELNFQENESITSEGEVN